MGSRSLVFSGLLALCAGSALAADIIVRPGESRTVWIPRPQYVNVACVNDAPPPLTAIDFKTPPGKVATFPEWTAGVLNAAEPVDALGGLADIVTTFDVTHGLVMAKVWGARIGERTEFITRLKQSNCAILSYIVHDIRDLTTEGATIQASYQCQEGNPEIWVKVVVSRFQ